jgi:hypothetical protein
MSLVLYFVQVIAEACLSVILFRWNYIKAICLFLCKIENIKKSRKRFLLSCEELKRPAMSIRAVVKEIKKEIKLREIDVF